MSDQDQSRRANVDCIYLGISEQTKEDNCFEIASLTDCINLGYNGSLCGDARTNQEL